MTVDAGGQEADAVHVPIDAVACVVLAHNDPIQVRRLVGALAPFPVFLHCDAGTPDDVFTAMTGGLPDRVRLLPRLSTPWATWNAVAAEISGYRAALADTDAGHVAMLSGSDYPLVGSARIAEYLAAHAGRSITSFGALPRPEWRGGGLQRLKFRYRAYRRHMLVLPIPRRIPADVVPAGGSVLKVLARHHAQQLVDTFDARPDLVAFWRSTWCADETFVPTILNTPAFVPDWEQAHIDADLWFMDWLGGGGKSPEWLTTAHLPMLAERSRPAQGEPTLFARKFSSAVDPAVIDEIDSSLRRLDLPSR